MNLTDTPMNLEESSMNQLVLDTWSHILIFLDVPDMIGLQFINKQISNYVTQCRPRISEVNYLLEYFTPPHILRVHSELLPNCTGLRVNRRIKKTTSSGFISRRLIEIQTTLNNCSFSLTLGEICYKIILYGHLKYTKSLTYLIQNTDMAIGESPDAFFQTPSGETPSGGCNMSRCRAYIGDTEFTILCQAAIRSGHIKKLKALMRAKPRYHDCEAICEATAYTGNLEMLKWVRMDKYFMGNHSCAWDETVCSAAVCEGHLDVLKWALDNGCKWDIRIKIYAEKYGHTHLLPLVNKYCGDDLVGPTMYAVDKNDVHLLKWCLEKGYQWTEDTCRRAIEKGHTHIINTVHHLSYPIVSNIYELAVEYGFLKLLKWAHKNNFPIELNNVINLVAITCVKKCRYQIKSEGYDNNYGYGNDNFNIIQKYANIFEWLCSNKMSMVEYQLWIQKSFIEVPKIATQMIAWYITQCKNNIVSNLCDYMIGSQNLELLQWAHKYGFNLPDNICHIIANTDRSRVPTDILRRMIIWAHNVGFNIDSRICTLAVIHKDYQMLTWAAECGCDINMNDDVSLWNNHTQKMRDITYSCDLYNADNLELLKWLIDRGFTWDGHTITLALLANLNSLIKYTKYKQNCMFL